jgi:mono/diheme cytochrome c family protein
MKKSLLKLVGLVAVSALVLSACTSNADSPGLEYMPDMYRSPAVEAYVDYGEVRGRIDESKKTVLRAMTPPTYTIPFFGTDSTEVKLMMPYSRLANASFKTTHGLYNEPVTTNDEYTAAAADKNMIVLTALNSEKVLAKGKELFTAMCQHCHGEKGDGNGPMVVSGAYSGVPNYAERAALSDGQMFYSIYYGKGMMGSHRSLLNKKEIWTVIHYIRSLQSSEYGKFNSDGSATVADTTNQN